MVVSISGEVAFETPIKCKISGLSGVIVDESVEEHYLKKVERKEKCECAIEHKKTCSYADSFFDKNDVFSWTQHSRLISSIPKEVPWYLILGLKRIERVLLVGTSLNVVGEASKDDDGTVRIQRPLKGPFYVSGKTIDENIANFVDYARYCKDNSVALTMIGACLLAASTVIILEGGVALKCEKGTIYWVILLMSIVVTNIILLNDFQPAKHVSWKTGLFSWTLPNN
ncbi:putative E3 Ubiquitin ligase, GIDE-type [Medicago truncatula]|uniref:RING-type E3 ubiquitin transferase n=1 Tax=Medicago truncatula TaxID=3880 RepID=A0A396JSC9_MEDTR|nr:putative E3 Ubiquitin ligase, GIDE-type [Medicago truncatula]